MILSALALSLAAALPPAPARIDFQKLKAELAERTGGAATVDDLLASCRHTQLGAFDVWFPSYAEKEYADLHTLALAGLVDCQREWLELFGQPGSPGLEQGLLHCAELSAWLAKRGRPDEPPAASSELRALFMGTGALGYEPFDTDTGGIRVVLAPDRRDFQRLVAFFGEADPNLRGLYWHDGTRVWTEFWWNDLQVVALEYPPPAGDSDDPGEGFRMDFREPTGLEQHVAQRGAMGLVWHTFGGLLPPPIEVGLAQQLVVEAYGENNVRSGGSMRGSETAAFEAFVPGGNPSGGILPAISADSDWRADKGEDHFVKALRLSQKAAAKDAPYPLPGDDGRPRKSKHDKLAWFLVRSSKGSHPVRAPFLGQASLGKPQPPDAFASDYMEFFRAYKTAFLHWLRAEGTGKKKTAPEAWRLLFQKVAEAKGQGDFEALAAEVYGMPYSAPDGPDQDVPESLEWSFLAWLSKQR